MADWTQVSGDSQASEYGATFAQVDEKSDGGAYGVYVVEIVNGYDTCGSDWTGDTYLTESSYVDVDGMDVQRARQILDSHGAFYYHGSERLNHDAIVAAWDIANTYDGVPLDVRRVVVTHWRTVETLRKLAAWERRELTSGELADVQAHHKAAVTLLEWYKVARMQRAEMAASYGGYTDGQSLTFATLADAMQYHGIPRAALWDSREYDAPAPECD